METLNHTAIAERIMALMRKLGLNQSGLAKALDITQPAVSKYLNDRMPPVEVFYQLALIGNVTIEWLLTGREPLPGLRISEPQAQYQSRDKFARLPHHVQEALHVILDELAGGNR